MGQPKAKKRTNGLLSMSTDMAASTERLEQVTVGKQNKKRRKTTAEPTSPPTASSIALGAQRLAKSATMVAEKTRRDNDEVDALLAASDSVAKRVRTKQGIEATPDTARETATQQTQTTAEDLFYRPSSPNSETSEETGGVFDVSREELEDDDGFDDDYDFSDTTPKKSYWKETLKANNTLGQTLYVVGGVVSMAVGIGQGVASFVFPPLAVAAPYLIGAGIASFAAGIGSALFGGIKGVITSLESDKKSNKVAQKAASRVESARSITTSPAATSQSAYTAVSIDDGYDPTDVEAVRRDLLASLPQDTQEDGTDETMSAAAYASSPISKKKPKGFFQSLIGGSKKASVEYADQERREVLTH